MTIWRPDPTFYPSPRTAMRAPPEKLAYVGVLNADGKGRPDALAVLDVDPDLDTYEQSVGRVDMPNAGDELHHFGWNACSAGLCPYAPHPHVERHYGNDKKHALHKPYRLCSGNPPGFAPLKRIVSGAT
jgi:selenium-binding protein 1